MMSYLEPMATEISSKFELIPSKYTSSYGYETDKKLITFQASLASVHTRSIAVKKKLE